MTIDRTMQLVAYGLYAVAGLEPALTLPDLFTLHRTWLLAYIVLGVALYIGSSAKGRESAKRRTLALGVMTLANITMAAVLPCNFGALTLVVVASQAALALPTAVAAVWVTVQTLAIGSFLIPTFGWESGLPELIALLGFEGFAVVAVAFASRESTARALLLATNAELRAARQLLDEATRREERTRIARDLHDVLGHNLTALGLQLEIASHVPEAAARVQVGKARELTARLLGDVRAVVAEMGTHSAATLAEAIRALVVEVPGLDVHLEIPEALVVDDAKRAECVVRCVQEIVTNSRKHADAKNIWITLTDTDDEIRVVARDDGKGPKVLSHGAGLRGMRARLEELGGCLELDFTASRPLQIRASLPLRALFEEAE